MSQAVQRDQGRQGPTSQCSAEDRERIARRYPPPQGRRLRIAVIGVLAVLLVVWTVWAGVHRSVEPVRVQVFGYHVVSDYRVDVTLDIHRGTPSDTGSCTIYASSIDSQRVGEMHYEIAPGTATDIRVRTSVKTFSRAVTAQLENCQAHR
ncbi:DUF4307 domain-containing protein [Acidipropionibacterium thoenii]|uniref:DUF4307 domain-containing protein n=1 Tax=Acidipropionibacterium thoenii TaxID=1751 RepID=UPI001FE1FFC3|nr:DUF4307 domain-containing protein [Acidipropionibacterium thoenii]